MTTPLDIATGISKGLAKKSVVAKVRCSLGMDFHPASARSTATASFRPKTKRSCLSMQMARCGSSVGRWRGLRCCIKQQCLHSLLLGSLLPAAVDAHRGLHMAAEQPRCQVQWAAGQADTDGHMHGEHMGGHPENGCTTLLQLVRLFVGPVWPLGCPPVKLAAAALARAIAAPHCAYRLSADQLVCFTHAHRLMARCGT